MAVCSLLAAGPASADGADTGLLRVAHLSPDSPAVDVAVAPATSGPLTDPGNDLTQGLSYGDVSPFTGLAPGSYAVSIRAAGSAPTDPPALSARVEVPVGGARTIAISGLFADLAMQPLTDDLSPPLAGSARVRAVSAAAGVPDVDVALRSGVPLATSLAFSDAAVPVTVPAGAAEVLVDDAPALPVEFAAGSASTLLILDAPDGGLTVRVVLDAAGPDRVPVGAVEAGSGPRSAGWPALALTGLALAGLGAAGPRGRTLLVSVATATALATAPGASAQAAPFRPVTLVTDHATTAAAPVRLRIPGLGIDTALVATGLDGAGGFVPPADGALAGWYRQGPAPGEVGPAVLAGHVDGGGAPAVFFRLRDLVPGDEVLVERVDGTTVRFLVSAVARYPKDAFPTATVYGPTPHPELRLITCGGSFDRSRGSYRDNVVVSARLG